MPTRARCGARRLRPSEPCRFIGLKLGFYLGEGPNHTGIVLFDDLDLPAGATDSCPPAALRIDEAYRRAACCRAGGARPTRASRAAC